MLKMPSVTLAKPFADGCSLQSLVDELCATSPEFAAMWRDNDVQGHGDGVKIMHHPTAGPLSMEFSGFAVDGPARHSLIFQMVGPDGVTCLEAHVPAGTLRQVRRHPAGSW